MYYESPVFYVAIFYALFYVGLLIHEWEDNKGMRMETALNLLLWPVIVAILSVFVLCSIVAGWLDQQLTKKGK